MVDMHAVTIPLMYGVDLEAASRQELEAWKPGLEQLLARVLALRRLNQGLRLACDGLNAP